MQRNDFHLLHSLLLVPHFVLLFLVFCAVYLASNVSIAVECFYWQYYSSSGRSFGRSSRSCNARDHKLFYM